MINRPTTDCPTEQPLSGDLTGLENLPFFDNLSALNDMPALDELSTVPLWPWRGRPSNDMGYPNYDNQQQHSVLQSPNGPMMPISLEEEVTFELDSVFNVGTNIPLNHAVTPGTDLGTPAEICSLVVQSTHLLAPSMTTHKIPFQDSLLSPQDTIALSPGDMVAINDEDLSSSQQCQLRRLQQDAPLAFPEMEEISACELDIENFAHVQEVTAEHVDGVAQLAQRMEREPSFPKFVRLKIPPSPVLNSWVQLYFEHFHPIFPLLHKPSFNRPDAHWLLIFTVAAIGAQFSEMRNAVACSRSMHEMVRRQSSYLVSNWIA